MLIDFFTHLRRHKLPCSLRELLDLHAALAARLDAWRDALSASIPEEPKDE